MFLWNPINFQSESTKKNLLMDSSSSDRMALDLANFKAVTISVFQLSNEMFFVLPPFETKKIKKKNLELFSFTFDAIVPFVKPL